MCAALFARVGARAHFMRGRSVRDEWVQEPRLMLDWSDAADASATADDAAAAAAVAAVLSSRRTSVGEEEEGEASVFACICSASAAAATAVAAAAASSGSKVDKMMQPSQLEIRFTHHTPYVLCIYTSHAYTSHITHQASPEGNETSLRSSRHIEMRMHTSHCQIRVI